ncbi:DNA/RNA helicase [Sulfobacillus acidophilus TPY]|uniref:Type III restriction protein res subunit n=1 Tax=Sulfobacillus acidophilus (strain ATCC 700253 / DSM 10332 / NAL) TaxID=679936 RepID=G8TV35_SULAD|nr:DNA/RNA helicase [Sulfobacillus acidophilus TPY]AEW03616.1 type III restriction protein res subunit [Sulfobacillus acidophilus DSM 10332]
MNNPRLITRHLGTLVNRLSADAKGIYLLLAFVRTSGVDEIFPALSAAVQAGADLKILTGDYLWITEPEALARLLTLGPQVEIRLWYTDGQAFHPKAFLFESETTLHVIIGSSNLSRSAVTTGVEWNVLVEDAVFEQDDPVTEFMRLFYAEQTGPVNPVTIEEYQRRRDRFYRDHPAVERVWADSVSWSGEAPVDLSETERGSASEELALRPVQIEAFEALSNALQQGYRRGLVVLPTGLGKTYLAAFFARQFRRVLFIAHRDEILRQAARTFHRVLPDRSLAFYTGSQKGAADMVFASVFTLAGKRHRERFLPDTFDLVVVDEFHHAAAKSYEALLDYFTPRFLLGLTATPERMDNKDVYALCDGNLVYQEKLPDAIRKKWLVPFHYYGVYDPIDYRTIPWRGTHYDEEALERVQTQESYAAWILAGWQNHRQSRTLAFCAGVTQAEYLAAYFSRHGVAARALTGKNTLDERRRALAELEHGDLSIIFSVDLFNEGLDIPSTDTILLVRPTDSSVVFLQQIGRGLRTFGEKTHCTIIDFVGNYRNADERFAVLGVAEPLAALQAGTDDMAVITRGLPPNCFIALDLQVIDVLQKIEKRRSSPEMLAIKALKALKEEVGRRPTYLEFHLKSGVDGKLVKDWFKSYPGFLAAAEELNSFETAVYEKARGWLEVVEKTSMSQSYKMVLLRTMLDRGPDRWDEPVTPRELAPGFYAYLHDNGLWMRETQRQTTFRDRYEEKAVVNILVKNPVKFLSERHPESFSYMDGLFRIRHGGITAEERTLIARWTREIVEYRLHRYFYRDQAY